MNTYTYNALHVLFMVGGLALILLFTAEEPDSSEVSSLIWFTLLAILDRIPHLRKSLKGS